MNNFQKKWGELFRSNPGKTPIKFKGAKPSEYYITSYNKELYAWSPMYYKSFKEDEIKLIEEAKIPSYFIEITEDNCEILDGVPNTKLMS